MNICPLSKKKERTMHSFFNFMYAYACTYVYGTMSLWAYRKLSKRTPMYMTTSGRKKYDRKGIQCQLKAMESCSPVSAGAELGLK